MNPATRASYRDIQDWQGSGYLDRLQPFIGHSMAAGWNIIPAGRSYYRLGRPAFPGDLEAATREAVEAITNRKAGDRLLYVVWSYSTDVATYDPDANESWVSPNYWGQTTARHLGCCRRALPRIRSNDPSAIEGVGPDCRVRWEEANQWYNPSGRVIETHPLAGAIRVREDDSGTERVLPREAVTLI